MDQSLAAWEWVLVDDGSNAETQGVLQHLQASDHRIVVISHGKNRGLPVARNTGFRGSSADFVFVLDSDDLIEPTTLEKCAWRLSTHPGDAFTKGCSVGFGGQEYLWTKGYENAAAFLERNQVDTTAMIRRNVHERVGGYDETLRTGPDDWDFWLRCAAAGYWGSTIPEFLDWYRRRADVRSGWNTVDREARRLWFIEEARRRYPKLFEDGAMERIAAQRADAAGGGGAGVDWSAIVEACERDRAAAGSRGRHALVVIERYSAAEASLERLDALVRAGWGLTIVATEGAGMDAHPDLALFARRTSDVFVARHIVPEKEVERFVSYLAASRGVEQVVQGLPVARTKPLKVRTSAEESVGEYHHAA